jgi:hypothetical protein
MRRSVRATFEHASPRPSTKDAPASGN